jgi:general secretion pathway protein G
VLNSIRTKQANDEGFTLIEMLIVIVVLGVLAGITVFGVSTFKGDSETAACKADVKTVATAAQAYEAAKGSWVPGADSAARVTKLVADNYLRSQPGTTVTVGDATAKTVTATCGGVAVSY